MILASAPRQSRSTGGIERDENSLAAKLLPYSFVLGLTIQTTGKQMEYCRHISKEFILALNALHASDQGGWWRGLLADKDLFVALRNESLNAYYRGCSIAELRLVGGEVRAFTHYKYLLKPALKSPMVEARQGEFQFPAAWQRSDGTPFTSSLADLAAIKRAAKPYAGREKKFVGDVIRLNDSVFDVEIALTRQAEQDPQEADEEAPEATSRTSPDRIDIAALKASGQGIELVFYEAKLFGNNELRARENTPAVIGQIERYEKLLENYQAAIKDSCLKAAQNVLDLNGFTTSRKVQAEKLLEKRDSFTINTQPVLIVGGFDVDQRDGQVWKSHHDKLVAALGTRLKVVGDAASVRL
jgi:hypothetical protein